MKTLLIAATLGAVAFGATAPANAQINRRQANQQARIDQGVASGEITRHEYRHSERRQARIASYEARSRADGGGLSHHERRKLNRMQNHAGRHIYNQKHDSQTRRYR